MEHLHDTIWLNHWVQALYAWGLYQLWVILFNLKHHFDDNKDGKISKSEYRRNKWRYIGVVLFSFMCIPIGVLVLPYVWENFTSLEFFEYGYFGAGIASIYVERYLHNKLTKDE